ncbi:peptidase [Alicyclobacillus sp. SO9]|nr:peptidase [Alicyclobacillus sp. SO9]
MQDIKGQIKLWIESHYADNTRLLQQMVRIPSLEGNEKKIQHFIAKTLEDMKLKVDVWEPDSADMHANPHFCGSRTQFHNSPNVVGVLQGANPEQDGARSIILNGHVDVVPIGDVSQWETDPWSGKILENRLYGRGSTDMKGGLAASIIALQCLVDLNVQLMGDVILESVIDEESGGAGTLATLMRGYTADAAIIPEPTNLHIFAKQQGSMWFRIKIKGRSAHGGTRYEGISAIEKAMYILSTVQSLENVRNARITDPFYKDAPIPIPINVGVIKGGDWPSSVPDNVELEGRMGIAPDETLEQAKRELEDSVLQAAQQDSWLKDNTPVIEWFGARWLPGQVGEDHPIVRTIVQGYRDVIQEEPTLKASPWGTDGGLMQTMRDIPFVIFGPGVTEIAHFPNEYVEIDKVMKCSEILAVSLIEWCGTSS